MPPIQSCYTECQAMNTREHGRDACSLHGPAPRRPSSLLPVKYSFASLTSQYSDICFSLRASGARFKVSLFLFLCPVIFSTNQWSLLSARHSVLVGSRMQAICSFVHWSHVSVLLYHRNRKAGTRSRSGDYAFGFRGIQLCLPQNVGRGRFVSYLLSVTSNQ